jgi:hypothetical protein
MDRTNYTLLSIISIVAITAILAMFLFARAGEGVQAPADALTGLFSVSITGHVTASAPQQERQPQPQGDPLDLNNDGKLDAADAVLLGQVIDRAQFCPRNKRCDVNGDGVIDMQDLGLLNSEIISRSPAKTAQPTAQPARIARSATANKALSVGAFGGIA